jgi:cyclopropane fatty-acyl-phospholipid synthase-like methyltransferase
MAESNPYRTQWDSYVQGWDRDKIEHSSSSTLNWPGDEWAEEEEWSKIFQAMFLDFGAADWKNCVEIGAGSGKYTDKLLRQSAAQILAFDISPAYLEVLRKRLAADLDAGRLHPVLLNGAEASEMLNELERRRLVRKIDALYSIDAMVHVDFQYLMAYFLTAALCLSNGGRLIMTLPNAVSEYGFEILIQQTKMYYPLQGVPSAKFEWLCPEMVQQVLERLGFSVQFLSPFSSIEVDRDLYVIATLVDLERAQHFQNSL